MNMDMNTTTDMDKNMTMEMDMNMHKQSFEFSSMIEYLLFYDWNITTAGALFGVTVGLACVCVFYEGIRVVREYLFLQTQPPDPSCCNMSTTEASTLWPNGLQMTRTRRIQLHTQQTLLHVLQVTLGYLLMLCVMTYNAWVLIAVVLALGLGYFLLGAINPKQYSSFDPEVEPKTSRAPSCCQEPATSYSTISTVSQTLVE